jgi:microcin C transport system permease protein
MKMSPIFERRWNLFRSHKRAYYSLWLIAAILFITLFAEFLCNSRPIIVSYDQKLYFPILKSYPETTFGGDFQTEADFTDPYMIEKVQEGENWAIFPPVRFRYDEIDFDLGQPAPSAPSARHLLGTDDRARDVFSRLIYGVRLSTWFGLLLAVVSSLIGIAIGAVQGFWGGKVDLFGQRFIEIWSSLPELYLLIILSSIFSPSVGLIFLLLSLFGWMGLSSYVRAEFLKARKLDYVESARVLGASRPRMIIKHILPNALVPIVTFFPFRVSAAITGLTALDFLGLGVPSPTPSLGELLSQGKGNLQSWWIMVSTALVLILLILLLNFIGEGVQRAMDPKAISDKKN